MIWNQALPLLLVVLVAANPVKVTIERKNGVFQNPFPEFKALGFLDLMEFAFTKSELSLPDDPKDLEKTLPLDKISKNKLPLAKYPNLISWIGHASCVIKIGGVFVLADPIFSDYCAMIQFDPFQNTKRYRPPGVNLDEIPRVDAVVISHNHYDHLDYNSVVAIKKKNPEVRFFVPLGLKGWFSRWITEDNVYELNWWEDREVEFENGTKVKFTCVPAQHWSMRNGFDRNHSLWAGWTLSTAEKSVYFSGDTGYNDRIFNQIGHHLGPFDLSLIPIGAYKPRKFLKGQHVNPTEAVMAHRELKSKFSVGVHWGTFKLSYEHYLAPKGDLAKAVEKVGIGSESFVSFKHGQTEEF